MLKKKRLNGKAKEIVLLMDSLFVAIDDDMECLKNAREMLDEVKKKVNDDFKDGCVDADTVMEMLKLIVFLYEDEQKKDNRITDIADRISAELNSLKEF